MSKEEAREELTSIIRDMDRGSLFVFLKRSDSGCGEGRSDADRVMNILRAHPSLAAETFKTTLHGVNGSITIYTDRSKQPYQEHFPAALILCTKEGGSNIDLVKEALSFYPKALYETKGWFDETLLHVACNDDNKSFVTLPVLEYLAKQNPAAICTRNNQGELPVHYFTSRLKNPDEIPKELPKLLMLLQLRPESLLLPYLPLASGRGRGRLRDNKNLFDYYFPDACLEVQQALVECYNPTQSTHKCLSQYWTLGPKLAEAQLVASTFPKLDKVDFGTNMCFLEGYKHIFKCLIENQSITDLTLHLQGSFYDSYDVSDHPNTKLAPTLLHQLLSRNGTVQKLHLKMPKRGYEVDHKATMETLLGGLAGRNISISELTMEEFWVASLQELIAKTRLKVMILKGCDITIKDAKDLASCNATTLTPDRKCRLERFEFIDGNHIRDWASVSRLLHQLAGVPSLKTFRWDMREKDPYTTSPLAENVQLALPLSLLLQKENKLASFSFEGERLADIGPLCAALYQNKQLKQFHLRSTSDAYTGGQSDELLHVLKDQGNTVLEDIQLTWTKGDTTPKSMEKIQHYARLNRFGRKLARDPSTALGKFVILLGKVVDYPTESRAAAGALASLPLCVLSTTDKVDVLYGLLQECPNMWTGQ